VSNVLRHLKVEIVDCVTEGSCCVSLLVLL